MIGKRTGYLIAALIAAAALSACAPTPLPTSTPAPTFTFTAAPATIETFTATPSATPAHTSTPVPTPTHTATPVPAPVLPALAEGIWPALPRLIFEKADHSLWAATFDRGQPWPVTGPLPEGTSAVHWAVSSDGRWLAVVQSVGWRDDQADGTLFLVHLETGRIQPLIASLLPADGSWRDLPADADRAALWENQPAWSPDSTKLAFVSAHEGRADLYVYDANSRAMERVAGGEGNVAWPQWSPDGGWLLYNTVQYFGTGAGPTGGALWAIEARSGATTRPLTPSDRFELVVGWLDDRQIITVQHTQPAPQDVTLIDLVSGERTLLLGGPVRDAVWSDTARLLAVVPYKTPDYVPDGVWLIDPRQPDPMLLDGHHDLNSPNWSPDGRYLLYSSEQSCVAYDVQTGQTFPKPEAWCSGQWSPHSLYIAYSDDSLKRIEVETDKILEISPHPASDVRWSPDDEWLLWLRQSSERKFDLFARQPVGGTLRPITYQVSRDTLRQIAWIPSKNVFIAPVSITQTVNVEQEIETQPTREEMTHVVFMRDRLLFRADWDGKTERIAQTCTFLRLYPENNLHMTNSFYAFLKPAFNGHWVAIENDDLATCLVDTWSGEGHVLPAQARVSWEPQGTRFAYVAMPQVGGASLNGTLYIYDTPAGIAQPFFRGEGLFGAIWSPDGAHIAIYANYADVPLTYSVLDVHTGEVRYTGPYEAHLGTALRWSADGARLAISRNNTETLECEWDVLDIASGEVTRLPFADVAEANGWQPDNAERHRTALSHSGHYLARAQPPQRSGEPDWWTQPSMVSIIDAETGETVREWQISGLVPSVRWSAGDGWLILGVLQVQDVACEHPEFGPCGVYSSVWRLPVNGAGEPEMVVDDGFLVEAISIEPAGHTLPAPSGLVIEAYALSGSPQVEPLTFEPVQGVAQEILQKRQAEREKRVKRMWKKAGEMSVAFGEGQLTATLIYTNTAERQLIAVQVTYDGDVIYTVPLGPASPVDKLQELWAHDGHWYLEVADWQGRGQVIRDGESLNERDGCEETFGFQVLHGKPFWFYRREGRIGVSFDGQETLLGYEDVRHNECCSIAELNPIRAENMVAFFARRDRTWYYIEAGVYE